MNTEQYSPSAYVLAERREYSLYTITDRAIPSICDGLKPSWRRCLWKGRDGSKYKTATLAGAAMSLHPHSMPDDAINTITGPYLNNIPLFKGIGSFGAVITPNNFGASRYTSVQISTFTKEVLFADLDIVPMVPNYDGSENEPKHFLPLVPVCLLNPSSGLAVGFACNILPRRLAHIIESQISHLSNKPIVEPPITFTPIAATSIERTEVEKSGNVKWTFQGQFERTVKRGITHVEITQLPYGVIHMDYIKNLNNLVANGTIAEYSDASKKTISIHVKMKLKEQTSLSDAELMKVLKLVNSETENLTIVDTNNHPKHMSYTEVIQMFTDWRLGWYVKRYDNRKQILAKEKQRVQDIVTAIEEGIVTSKSLHANRNAISTWCVSKGIVNVDYIAGLPMYRFTQEELANQKTKLNDLQQQIDECDRMLNNPTARVKQYISELKQVLKQFKEY